MTPVNTFGTVFLISPAPNMENELFKILATRDNTKVYVNGILKTVLNKGGTYEELFSTSSFIKTTFPVITAHFGVGICSLSQQNGGPYMTIVTPFEQAIKNSTVVTSVSPPAIVKQFLQIYTRTKDKNLTTVNGKNIGSLFNTFSTNPEYASANIVLDSGAYAINNNNGFTAEVNANGSRTFGTYFGYSAGSLLNKSNQYASVNGNSSNLQKEFLFCPLQAVNFEAVRQDTVFSKVFWHFDDGSIDSGNVVNKTFKDTGCHQVQMISYYSGSSGNCLLGNGATDTTFLKVCVVNSLPLSIGNDTGFCRNRPLTLQSNINPDGFSYLWSTGATSSAISVTETGNYWLELKNGNCAIRDSVQVTVVDKPVLSIQGDKLLCSGDSILLQNSVNSPTVTYTWNNGKKGFSQWINKPGLYSLSGIDRGCYAETSINIGELSCPEIYVPTGFTPDGDGRNDIIRPICAGIDLVYFRVYNRYGQMIFETREDGKGWNGKLNGIQQSMATYVYVVEGRDKSGRQHIRKGTFVLIR
jgi:gliding motility-associated-like protein